MISIGPIKDTFFPGRNFKELGLDYWVSGYGTGGTFSGVSRVLKEQSPKTKLVITEPDNAQLVSSLIAQKRNQDGSPASGHDSWNSHPIQGWTPDFIQDVLDSDIADQIVPQNEDVSIQ